MNRSKFFNKIKTEIPILFGLLLLVNFLAAGFFIVGSRSLEVDKQGIMRDAFGRIMHPTPEWMHSISFYGWPGILWSIFDIIVIIVFVYIEMQLFAWNRKFGEKYLKDIKQNKPRP